MCAGSPAVPCATAAAAAAAQQSQLPPFHCWRRATTLLPASVELPSSLAHACWPAQKLPAGERLLAAARAAAQTHATPLARSARPGASVG